MDQRDADEVIGRLSARMRDVGLDWVVDSAVEEIRLGREVPSTELISVPGSKRALKPTADSLTTVPLTPDEQVWVVVEAVRRSVVDVAALEAAVGARFAVEAEATEIDTREIAFVSPDPDDNADGQNGVVLRLGLDGPSAERREAVVALAERLDRLTAGADDAR